MAEFFFFFFKFILRPQPLLLRPLRRSRHPQQPSQPPSSVAPATHNRPHNHPPLPIVVPKYPPPKPKPKPKLKTPSKSQPKHPFFTKLPHNRSKYYKPISQSGSQIQTSDDRSILIGDSGVSYLLPGALFEFQFSYSGLAELGRWR